MGFNTSNVSVLSERLIYEKNVIWEGSLICKHRAGIAKTMLRLHKTFACHSKELPDGTMCFKANLRDPNKKQAATAFSKEVLT